MVLPTWKFCLFIFQEISIVKKWKDQIGVRHMEATKEEVEAEEVEAEEDMAGGQKEEEDGVEVVTIIIMVATVKGHSTWVSMMEIQWQKKFAFCVKEKK